MRRAWFIRRAVCVALLAGGASQIQAADSDSTAHRVRIVQAGEILRDPSVPGAQRLIGEVVLSHRDATLRCDSAWRFDDGRFSAMGNVRAERSGSWFMTAQQLLWDPTSERLDAFGNPAKLVEGSLSVTGPSLQYDWSRERATFSQRSHLSTPERQADANRGRYDSDTGWLTLGGQVTVEGEVEHVESDSLKVHAREGGLQLLGPSRIAHRSGEWDIRCERGEIASDSGWVAGEAVRAWVRRGAEGVWADSLAWSEPRGRREAWGQVEALDTALSQVVRGDYLIQRLVDSTWVSRVEGGVTLIQASAQDTLILTADALEDEAGRLVASPDVVFRQGQALGACAELIWFDGEEKLRMLQDPHLWFEGQILSADTLELTLSDGAPDHLFGNGHAQLIRSINDTCADQISGRMLTGNFRDGILNHLLVEGNGEAIYFVEDDAELQFNRAACSRMRIQLEDAKVREIALLDAPSGRFLALSASVPGDRWLEGAEVLAPPPSPSLGPWPPMLPER